MADNRGSTAAVLLAFLSGAALGAVAAVLLAPESGAESRERVRKYARRAEGELQNLAGRAGEVFEEVVGQGKEFVDAKKSRAEGELQNLAGRAGEVFEEVVGQGKEFVDAKKSAFEEAFEAGREAMRQERDRLRNGGSNGA
ncbi:MAG: hypothetical protein HP494_15210 [Nitrospira sp.]|nr:hypothetical protein [Nitrospira sp.]